jgi:hypothetical protein
MPAAPGQTLADGDAGNTRPSSDDNSLGTSIYLFSPLSPLNYSTGYLTDLSNSYLGVQRVLDETKRDKKLLAVSNREFKQLKEKLIIIDELNRHDALPRDESLPAFINTIISSDSLEAVAQMVFKAESGTKSSGSLLGAAYATVAAGVASVVGGRDRAEVRFAELRSTAKGTSDVSFLHELTRMVDVQPLLAGAASRASELARDQIRTSVASRIPEVVQRIMDVQDAAAKKRFEKESRTITDNEVAEAKHRFIEDTQDILKAESRE